MKQAYFITGTDTGVGKTLVTCGLMRGAAANGFTVAGMKPIAAGATMTPNGWRNDDAQALSECATIKIAHEMLNPYFFKQPIAPHIAAQIENASIDIEVIHARFKQICEAADRVFVEGAGGFKVPLNDRHDMSDLALALNLPVILVVGMRLGCLNHALLTRDAISAKGLQLAGWVANQVDAQMAMFDDNKNYLAEHMGAPLLCVMPFMTAQEQTLFSMKL